MKFQTFWEFEHRKSMWFIFYYNFQSFHLLICHVIKDSSFYIIIIFPSSQLWWSSIHLHQVRFAQISENGKVSTRRLGIHRGRVHKLAIEPGSPHIFYSCGEDGLVQHVGNYQLSPSTFPEKFFLLLITKICCFCSLICGIAVLQSSLHALHSQITNILSGLIQLLLIQGTLIISL